MSHVAPRKNIIITAVLVLLSATSALHYRMYQQSKREKAVVKEIENLGGNVKYGPIIRGIPTYIWKHDLRLFGHVTEVDLGGANITNDNLRDIIELEGIQYLDIQKTYIDDDGLISLASLPNLRHLVLSNTMTTEQGLKRFKQARPDVITLPEVSYVLPGVSSNVGQDKKGSKESEFDVP